MLLHERFKNPARLHLGLVTSGVIHLKHNGSHHIGCGKFLRSSSAAQTPGCNCHIVSLNQRRLSAELIELSSSVGTKIVFMVIVASIDCRVLDMSD